MTERPLHEIVADIASVTVTLSEPSATRYFLYVEFDRGVTGPTLLQEAGEHLSWLRSWPLKELLFKMNHVSDPKPIGAFALDIEGDKFSAAFDYEAELLEGTDERLAAAVKARFGDKPIVYPPLPTLRERSAAGEFG